MVYMYVMNGYYKAQHELWTSGEATVLIMGLDNTTYFLGEFMRNFPTLLQYGGLTWYYMLLFAWLLPLLRGRKRIAFVSMFIAGHASFVVTVRIGAFAYVAFAGLLLFLQAQFWDDLRAVAYWLGFDGSRGRALEAALSRVGRRVPNPRFDSEASVRGKTFVFDVVLGVVVITIALLIAVSIGQAVEIVGEDPGHDEEIENVARGLSIYQPDWSVFAPTPRTTDRYYVFPAETTDGELIDVYSDRPVSYDRPDGELQEQLSTYRERFYMNSVRSGGPDGDVPATLADYKCTKWDEEHGVELTQIHMYVVSETVTVETIDEPSDRDRDISLFHRHDCADTEPETAAPPEE
jgi:hypothetical protein